MQMDHGFRGVDGSRAPAQNIPYSPVFTTPCRKGVALVQLALWPCRRSYGIAFSAGSLMLLRNLAAVAPPDAAWRGCALPVAPTLGGAGLVLVGTCGLVGHLGAGLGLVASAAHGVLHRDLGGARLSAQRRADPQSLFCGEPRGPPRDGSLPHGAVVGRGICVLPRRDRPGALLLHLPRRDVRLTLGPARGARTRGACRGTSEGKGHSWRGMFREEEVSANFLTLTRSRRWKRPFDFPILTHRPLRQRAKPRLCGTAPARNLLSGPTCARCGPFSRDGCPGSPSLGTPSSVCSCHDLWPPMTIASLPRACAIPLERLIA